MHDMDRAGVEAILRRARSQMVIQRFEIEGQVVTVEMAGAVLAFHLDRASILLRIVTAGQGGPPNGGAGR